MGLYTYDSTPIPKSDRIPKLVRKPVCEDA